MSAETFSGRFVRPVRELRTFTQFAFILPQYRPRGADNVRRLPAPRATIYYAADVKPNGSACRTVSGLFCEGPHSRAFQVTHECAEMVAIKVRPGGLRALLGVPARELRDETIPMEEIWGKHASFIAERMAGAPSKEARLAILQQELIRRCRAHGDADPVPLVMSKVLERTNGKIRIADLIARSGYSQRALLEKFDDWVGLTPKQYARLARLRAAIVRLGKPLLDPSDLAAACGFTDQAHMIHEFQDLIGLSPRQFVEQKDAFGPEGAPAFGQSALPGRERQLYGIVGMVSQWVV